MFAKIAMLFINSKENYVGQSMIRGQTKYWLSSTSSNGRRVLLKSNPDKICQPARDNREATITRRNFMMGCMVATDGKVPTKEKNIKKNSLGRTHTPFQRIHNC